MPTTPVLDSTIVHREHGSGAPIVFLHGNPTSSYLWRHVLPAVGRGRRLAPDLIGMGDSGKPAIDYTFDDHARYLDAWFDALGLDSVVLVGHDWGGALAFDFAARHPGRVRGIAFTETIVKPMAWEEFPEGGRELFRAIKTEGVGEAMILDDNLMIEEGLPGTVVSPSPPPTWRHTSSPTPPGRVAGRCCSGRARCRWGRACRCRRPRPGVRHVAREQHGRPQAIDRLRTRPRLHDEPGPRRLVREGDGRPRDRASRRPGRAPHPGGPSRRDRHGNLLLDGSARAAASMSGANSAVRGSDLTGAHGGHENDGATRTPRPRACPRHRPVRRPGAPR